MVLFDILIHFSSLLAYFLAFDSFEIFMKLLYQTVLSFKLFIIFRSLANKTMMAYYI